MDSRLSEYIKTDLIKSRNQFLNADTKARLYLICRKAAKYIMLLISFAAFILLYALRFLVPVKIGILNSCRVGHLAANTEFRLRRQYPAIKQSNKGILFLSGNPANRQLLTMIKRQMPVLENNLIYTVFMLIRSFFPKSPIWADLSTAGPYSYDVWNHSPPQLSFIENEIKRGEEFLLSLGILPGQSYICFCARDKTYLDKIQHFQTRKEWMYHDYRDNDISNYLTASEFLAEQGLWALRMGAVVQKAINSYHPRVIDYASRYRTDFADVYLMGHCKFFLGDTAGIFHLARLFNVPCALANLVPIGSSTTMAHDIVIPKKYRYFESKRFLTFFQVVAMGADRWFKSQYFEDEGIEVVENNPDEILALAQEMNARLDGTWKPHDEDEELQKAFWELFPPGHPVKGSPVRIGAEFLRQNQELLEM